MQCKHDPSVVDELQSRALGFTPWQHLPSVAHSDSVRRDLVAETSLAHRHARRAIFVFALCLVLAASAVTRKGSRLITATCANAGTLHHMVAREAQVVRTQRIARVRAAWTAALEYGTAASQE